MSKELSSAGQASVMSILRGTFFRVDVQEVILASAVQVLVYGIALPCPRTVECPGMAYGPFFFFINAKVFADPPQGLPNTDIRNANTMQPCTLLIQTCVM